MTRISSAVREHVRIWAQYRCEYCQKPEGYSAHGHHVDHIISQKHKGSDDIDNLAWACFQCNVNKGTDIAASDPDTGEIVRLYNPRIQEWNDHFQLNDVIIVAKTPIGRVTIDLLQMNDPEQIATRQFLIAEDLW